MATIAEFIAKPKLSTGKQSLRIVKATHDSAKSAYPPEKNQKNNGRIAILFGSSTEDGLATNSVMPSELDWILALWINKMGDRVSFDTETDFDEENTFDMRESIVESINNAKGTEFTVVVTESKVKSENGQPLLNCSFA